MTPTPTPTTTRLAGIDRARRRLQRAESALAALLATTPLLHLVPVNKVLEAPWLFPDITVEACLALRDCQKEVWFRRESLARLREDAR